VLVLARGPAPDGLEPGHVAEHVGLPLLAAMAPERGLERDLERGSFRPRPSGPLATAAAAVLAAARADSAGSA
jgi:hypothetical protein